MQDASFIYFMEVILPFVSIANGLLQPKRNRSIWKKLDDGILRDDSKAKGRLSIIEAEIYSFVEK